MCINLFVGTFKICQLDERDNKIHFDKTRKKRGNKIMNIFRNSQVYSITVLKKEDIVFLIIKTVY